MSRESAFSKGRRYLVEGRLIVVEVNEHRVQALCRGDSGRVYHVGLDAQGWSCDCPAVRPECSHLRALKLVAIEGGCR